jgi:serine/threonine protein kinase
MSSTGHGGTPPAIGSSIAHYRVLGQLGSGGMGDVYRAHDLKLNRDVAIKVLRGSWATDDDRVVRFRREAQLLASLNHPNIGQIHVQDWVEELKESTPEMSARLRRSSDPPYQRFTVKDHDQ